MSCIAGLPAADAGLSLPPEIPNPSTLVTPNDPHTRDDQPVPDLTLKDALRPDMAWQPGIPGVIARASIFNTDEIAQWALEHYPLEAEPMLPGISAVLTKTGTTCKLVVCGGTDDLLAMFIPLRQFVLNLQEDLILPCYVGVDRNGKAVSQSEVEQILASQSPELGQDGQITVTVCDCLYRDGMDMHDQPLAARREQLSQLFKINLSPDPAFRIAPLRVVQTRQELDDAARWALSFPESRGMLARGLNSTFPIDGGETQDWAELLKTLTLRVSVLLVHDSSDGLRIYECGISPRPGETLTNIRDNMIDLGLTIPTDTQAAVGDVLAVEALALVRDTQKQSVTWAGAKVMNRVNESGAHAWTMAEVEQAAERTDSLIIKAAYQRIVYGVVLRPNFKDAQDDIMTPQDVESAAHYYLENARVLGFRHRGKIAGAVLESYIAPVDFKLGQGEVKKGDWVLVVRIDDNKIWQMIQDGELNAFSVGGFGTRQAV